jgi:hypothetical protein
VTAAGPGVGGVEVTVATDLFSLGTDEHAVAFFTCRERPGRPAAAPKVWAAVRALREAGWRLSVSAMFTGSGAPTVYRTGFAHDVDLVGAFEAPTLGAAFDGIAALEAAGWDELFATRWLVGPREFQPVPSPAGRDPDAPWAFFALWEWNDAWQAATAQERADYDRECDVAFAADVTAGISIAGRHRLDAASSWHHLGIWEVPDLALLDSAMAEHERVADFAFTTSRHYIGRPTALGAVLGVD